jgi:hypothetical protein
VVKGRGDAREMHVRCMCEFLFKSEC